MENGFKSFHQRREGAYTALVLPGIERKERCRFRKSPSTGASADQRLQIALVVTPIPARIMPPTRGTPQTVRSTKTMPGVPTVRVSLHHAGLRARESELACCHQARRPPEIGFEAAKCCAECSRTRFADRGEDFYCVRKKPGNDVNTALAAGHDQATRILMEGPTRKPQTQEERNDQGLEDPRRRPRFDRDAQPRSQRDTEARRRTKDERNCARSHGYKKEVIPGGSASIRLKPDVLWYIIQK